MAFSHNVKSLWKGYSGLFFLFFPYRYYIFLLVLCLYGIPVCTIRCLWIYIFLVLFPWLFLCVDSYSDLIVLFLFYFIIIIAEMSTFSKERQKGHGSRWTRKGRWSRRIKRRKTVIRTYRKKIVPFSLKEKLSKKQT